MVAATDLYLRVDGDPVARKEQHGHCSLPFRPTDIGPIFDIRSDEPLERFSEENHKLSYTPLTLDDRLPPIPPRPENFTDAYLYPTLTRNERQRLTMLWYYTHQLLEDNDLLKRLQEKVELVQQFLGWEFAICGLISNDNFTRLAAAGLPLAILPRRESTCSHTIHQKPGSVFELPNMADDWRFKDSPHVKESSLRSYAGAQLRCRLDSGDNVALGSLCVASTTAGLRLSKQHQQVLVQFAEMITSEIVNNARLVRRRQQQRMSDLIAQAASEQHTNFDHFENRVTTLLKEVYPSAGIEVAEVDHNAIRIGERSPISLSNVRQSLWEDVEAIDATIASGKHASLTAPFPVRAVIGKYWGQPAAKVLCISTNDIKLVFDDIDAWFIERCANLIGNAAQERSLREAHLAKEQFLRGITHQLRTPIHGVLGSVDLLAEELAARKLLPDSPMLGGDADSQAFAAAEVLKTIRNSGKELMSTVNNMIKLNRWAEITSSRRQATLHDLNELESEVLDDVLQMLPDEEVSKVSIFFDNNLSREASIVNLDLILLKECLHSLVLNALQATTAGSVIITISASPDLSTIIFDVEDTGCGIAESDQARIFNAYEKTNIHTRGAGLGLTLATKIAAAQHGTVSLVWSKLGEGSQFRAEFQDPGFACAIGKRNNKLASLTALPRYFFVVPTDPPARLVVHLTNYLKINGLEEATEKEGSMVVVSFTPNPGHFQALLESASHAHVAASLVPAGENTKHVREKFPNVMFFSGPFTTARLDKMLEIIDQTCQTDAAKEDMGRTMAEVEAAASPEIEYPISCAPNVAEKRHRSKQPPQVLLVDDNAINLRIVRMFCEKRLLPYTTAMDGYEAIDAYRSAVEAEPITLILLDLQMPRCDGIQACTEIRALEREKKLSPCTIFIRESRPALLLLVFLDTNVRRSDRTGFSR